MTLTEKIGKIADELPSFCNNFIYIFEMQYSLYTALNYASDLKFFFNFAVNNYPYFPEKKIKEITVTDLANFTPNDINIYLSAMKDRYNFKKKTIARRKSSLSNLFSYLRDSERLLEYNPVLGAVSIRRIKNDNKDKNKNEQLEPDVIYLRKNEQEKLLKTVRDGTGLTNRELKCHDDVKVRDLAIVFLFLDTGLRISELVDINVQDIDFERKTVIVLRKGGKVATIYFSDETCEYLEDYLKERIKKEGTIDYSDAFFLSNQHKRIAVRTVQEMIKKYVMGAFHIVDEDGKRICTKPKITPHKLRSSFAMEFYKYSHDILLLKKRMGHNSITATQIYVSACEDEMIENVRNWRNE